MPVYQGIVKDNAIVLPAEVHLDDGMVVEVHVPANAAVDNDLAAREAAFRQYLIETGRLIKPPESPRREELEIIEPIQVTGKPLSEMIIEDRR